MPLAPLNQPFSSNQTEISYEDLQMIERTSTLNSNQNPCLTVAVNDDVVR